VVGYLSGKVIVVVGSGDPNQRAVATALAEAGADVVIAGPAAEAAQVLLHSISNEVWAIGRRSLVIGYDASSPVEHARALGQTRNELGRVDLVVRCEAVLSA
jgi:NAD(P)-dependent dehydrogenase (short-subunit alcohol dehydrogenase family)